MKKILLISVLALLTIAMYAQDYRMQSTSSYLQQTTAVPSAYSAPLSAPGASGPVAMYYTTYEPSSSLRARRSTMDSDDDDEESGWGDVGDFTPIGSPIIPLLLLAVAYVLMKKRKNKLI